MTAGWVAGSVRARVMGTAAHRGRGAAGRRLGLAEGIAVYGLIVAIILIGKA